MLTNLRVYITRYVQFYAHLPEHVVCWLIVKEECLAVRPSMLYVIDQCSVKAQLLDTSSKHFTGLDWVMHR